MLEDFFSKTNLMNLTFIHFDQLLILSVQPQIEIFLATMSMPLPYNFCGY